MIVQVVCITDPVLATQVLRSKVVDKLRFQYSFLDPVRGFQAPSIVLHCLQCRAHACSNTLEAIRRSHVWHGRFKCC